MFQVWKAPIWTSWKQHFANTSACGEQKQAPRGKGYRLPTMHLCSSSQVKVCQITNEPLKMWFSMACPCSPKLTCVHPGSWGVASFWPAMEGRQLALTCSLGPSSFLTEKFQVLATGGRGHFGKRNDWRSPHQHNWKISSPKAQAPWTSGPMATCELWHICVSVPVTIMHRMCFSGIKGLEDFLPYAGLRKEYKYTGCLKKKYRL